VIKTSEHFLYFFFKSSCSSIVSSLYYRFFACSKNRVRSAACYLLTFWTKWSFQILKSANDHHSEIPNKKMYLIITTFSIYVPCSIVYRQLGQSGFWVLLVMYQAFPFFTLVAKSISRVKNFICHAHGNVLLRLILTQTSDVC